MPTNTATPPAIFVFDDLPPETVAMLQALYSRDPRSVVAHLDRARASAGQFMGQYYVGYGHKSIGDCGTTTLFFEGVSMLAAKAIQDWPLYNGQEASTRYLDFSTQPVVHSIGGPEIRDWTRKLMVLYTAAVAAMTDRLTQEYPLTIGTTEGAHKKAIKARAFDICRSLLPAGMSTFVSWHTNLRQAADHLALMRHHPLAEVREIAQSALGALRLQYPSSFNQKERPELEEYHAKSQALVAYADLDAPLLETVGGEGVEIENRLNYAELARYEEVIRTRPARAELPHQLRSCGELIASFMIDFGSYRDFQRHRSMVCAQPLHTPRHGFHPWYIQFLEKLVLNTGNSVMGALYGLMDELMGFDLYPTDRQYYVPMGYQSWVQAHLPLPSAVYIAELRSSTTVHATLRPVAQELCHRLPNLVPGLELHGDMAEDAFSTKRGTHDIVLKA